MTTQPLGIVTLHRGHKMPLVGFGTYPLTSTEAKECVAYALSIGYRCIDTAEYYNNHEGIADALRDSSIPRSEIFVTDKLFPSKNGKNFTEGKTFEETIKAFHTHRERLGLDYVDLYLLHHAFCKDRRLEQYKALMQLQKEGFIREIGVSNWNINHFEELKAAGLGDDLPAVNQIEIHPLCTQETLAKYLKENGIHLQAYSSLAPLSTWRASQGRRKSKSKFEEFLQTLASKYGATASQILLKWALQLDYSVLPKSSKSERIYENYQLHQFTISQEDMTQLSSCNKNMPFAWGDRDPLVCE